jgi:hypothetical protein
MQDAPIITLSNGIRICNFSSPHSFTFDDGSILPACDSERSKHLMLHQTEEEIQIGQWTDIILSFQMSAAVDAALRECMINKEIDIVLIPFPVATAFKELLGLRSLKGSKLRVIRVKDRVSKVCYHNRFCI